jgi:YidC/Oxa1 family membrane protein insertase
MEELKTKHGDDPQQLQQEQMGLYKELGVNPLGGCLPLIAQMPVLFALYATFQGTPFADQKYQLNLQVVPTTQQREEKNQSGPHNIYLDPKNHVAVLIRPSEAKLPIGQSLDFQVLKEDGTPFTGQPGGRAIYWKIQSGSEHIKLEGNRLVAVSEGSAIVDAFVPGIAAKEPFLFIKGLGEVGLNSEAGIHWDILVMIVLYGGTLLVNQIIMERYNPLMTEQQRQTGKITPVVVTGMFLFFPFPAGVLLYMLVGNFFQIAQTFLLYREPLPEGIQKMQTDLDRTNRTDAAPIPFEKNSRRKRKKP